jgi:hypothetical protein
MFNGSKQKLLRKFGSAAGSPFSLEQLSYCARQWRSSANALRGLDSAMNLSPIGAIP